LFAAMCFFGCKAKLRERTNHIPRAQVERLIGQAVVVTQILHFLHFLPIAFLHFLLFLPDATWMLVSRIRCGGMARGLRDLLPRFLLFLICPLW
jgi:hypothetical protein